MYNINDKQKDFAIELATILDSKNSLLLYYKIVTSFSEKDIREALKKTMDTDESLIRKSRAALFTFLLKSKSARYQVFGNAD